MTIKLALAAFAAAALAAGAGHAQEFRKAKGDIILHVRVTDVAPAGTDPITTLAGASTGLRADTDYAVVPSVGLTYFFTDHIAAEVIATSTRHSVKAKGPGVDLKVKDTWVLPPVVDASGSLEVVEPVADGEAESTVLERANVWLPAAAGVLVGGYALTRRSRPRPALRLERWGEE